MIEEIQKHRGGRPKKQPSQNPFVGFMPEDLEDAYFRTPAVWMLIVAEIDNLAELKVVHYILRHTYGYTDKETGKPLYHQAKRISVEEFMNGRKRKDGTRLDWGTKLSDKAVKEGLTRAIEHGFIVCITDESDKARIKKYYALKMQEVQDTGIPDEEDYQQGVEDTGIFDEEDSEEENERGITNPSEGNINLLQGEYQSPRSKNKRKEGTLEEITIRKTHPSQKNDDSLRYLPHFSTKREKNEGPFFIRQLMEDFSRDCGDADHTISNITRAYNLYNAAHTDPETFQNLLYAARDAARKVSIRYVNNRGRPNRMPYLFTCLKKSLNLGIIPEKAK